MFSTALSCTATIVIGRTVMIDLLITPPFSTHGVKKVHSIKIQSRNRYPITFATIFQSDAHQKKIISARAVVARFYFTRPKTAGVSACCVLATAVKKAQNPRLPS
jgi:hypothetical protein